MHTTSVPKLALGCGGASVVLLLVVAGFVVDGFGTAAIIGALTWLAPTVALLGSGVLGLVANDTDHERTRAALTLERMFWWAFAAVMLFSCCGGLNQFFNRSGPR